MEYKIQKETLTNIADAIRTKSGSTAKINPTQMDEAIDNLPVSGIKTNNAKGIAYMKGGGSQMYANMVEDPVSSADWAFANSNRSDQYSLSPDTPLTTLNLSSWDTKQITSMRYMFSENKDFNSLVLGDKWDTSNVTNMSGIFNNSAIPVNVDLSKWDVSNVLDMSSAFSGTFYDEQTWQTVHLPFTADISSWDTSKVTNMSSMFFGRSFSEFPILDVSSAENVTNMFGQCVFDCDVTFDIDAFESVQSWDTWSTPFSNANMGNHTYKLKGDFTKRGSTQNLTNVTAGRLDLSEFTWSGDNLAGFLQNANFANGVNFGNMDTSSITDMSSMFFQAQIGNSIDLSGLDLSNVTNMSSMFANSSIRSITWGNNTPTNPVDINNMFSNIPMTTNPTLPSMTILNAWNCFDGVTDSLNLSNLIVSSPDAWQEIAGWNPSITSITLPEKPVVDGYSTEQALSNLWQNFIQNLQTITWNNAQFSSDDYLYSGGFSFTSTLQTVNIDNPDLTNVPEIDLNPTYANNALYALIIGANNAGATINKTNWNMTGKYITHLINSNDDTLTNITSANLPSISYVGTLGVRMAFTSPYVQSIVLPDNFMAGAIENPSAEYFYDMGLGNNLISGGNEALTHIDLGHIDFAPNNLGGLNYGIQDAPNLQFLKYMHTSKLTNGFLQSLANFQSLEKIILSRGSDVISFFDNGSNYCPKPETVISTNDDWSNTIFKIYVDDSIKQKMRDRYPILAYKIYGWSAIGEEGTTETPDTPTVLPSLGSWYHSEGSGTFSDNISEGDDKGAYYPLDQKFNQYSGGGFLGNLLQNTEITGAMLAHLYNYRRTTIGDRYYQNGANMLYANSCRWGIPDDLIPELCNYSLVTKIGYFAPTTAYSNIQIDLPSSIVTDIQTNNAIYMLLSMSDTGVKNEFIDLTKYDSSTGRYSVDDNMRAYNFTGSWVLLKKTSDVQYPKFDFLNIQPNTQTTTYGDVSAWIDDGSETTYHRESMPAYGNDLEWIDRGEFPWTMNALISAGKTLDDIDVDELSSYYPQEWSVSITGLTPGTHKIEYVTPCMVGVSDLSAYKVLDQYYNLYTINSIDSATGKIEISYTNDKDYDELLMLCVVKLRDDIQS